MRHHASEIKQLGEHRLGELGGGGGLYSEAFCIHKPKLRKQLADRVTSENKGQLINPVLSFFFFFFDSQGGVITMDLNDKIAVVRLQHEDAK